MSRTLKFNVPKLVLALAMTFGAGAAFIASPAYADAKCDAIKNAKVKAECAKGGVDGVKTFMKDLVKAANANPKKSKKHECADCHKDQKTFEVKPNADADFATLLSEAGK